MSELLHFSWHNISASVTIKKKSFWKTQSQQKIVLDDVSGHASGNSLVAIIGPSGSGKTTLLGALSGKLKNKTGTLKINNQIVDDTILKNISKYVHQHDLFVNTLSVLEYLHFQAALQLIRKTDLERQERIQKLLEDFGLDCLKNQYIKLLSGGEKRRLSLVSVLLDNISILFCDEPTTGLDSYNAVSVLKILQQITTNGKIVFTSIHQPSSQIFDMFQNIIILSNGHLIFEGKVETAKQFFESMNFFCPRTYNPADFYINCITVAPDQNDKRIENISVVFKTRYQYQINFNSLSDFPKFEKKTRNFYYEFKWVMWRTIIDNRRNMVEYMLGYICLLFSSMFLAISYATVSLENSNSVQNIQGLFLYIISEILFTNMYFVINIFPRELELFLREEALYTSTSYFIAKFLSLLPLCFLSSAGVFLILFIVESFLFSFKMYLLMTYMMFCASMSAIAIGLLFSAIFSTIEYVEVLFTPIEFLLMMMSGIWLKLDQLPIIFSGIKYLSPFFYAYESITVIFWRPINYIANCNNGTVICYENGHQVLKNYGFFKEYDIIPYNILYLHLLTLFYCIIGFIGILRKRMTYTAY